MKEHITPQDLDSLTGSQRETLRSMWLPEKNHLAAAFICTNVETDEYDKIEFVIGEVNINEKMTHHQVVLRRLRLVDEPEIEEETDEPADSDEEVDSEKDGYDEENTDEEFEMPYIEPEQYFNIEDCLPLLSIGQMLAILRKSKIGQNGLKIYLPPDTNKIFEQRLFTLEDNEGEAFENEELCDLLWDAVKGML